MNKNVIPMINKKFNRLMVLSVSGRDSSQSVTYNCLCDCGSLVVISGRNLRSGRAKSCGCFQKEKVRNTGFKNKTHGQSNEKIYKIWRGMINRCENPNVNKFENYGGRGISVCERWHIFENFFSDMGHRPNGKSLDRIDNNGNYEPGNCRWATLSEQNKNRRKFKKTGE